MGALYVVIAVQSVVIAALVVRNLIRQWVRVWVSEHGTAFFWQVEPGGYRPLPSTARKLPPPGSTAIPRKPGCYRAAQAVNPRTVKPPRGATAVRPAPNPTRYYTRRDG